MRLMYNGWKNSDLDIEDPNVNDIGRKIGEIFKCYGEKYIYTGSGKNKYYKVWSVKFERMMWKPARMFDIVEES